MKFTKALSLSVVFVILFTLLTACTEKNTGEGEVTTTVDAESSVTTPDVVFTGPNSAYEDDDLPKDKKWDDEIYLFTWSDQLYWEFEATTETGDTVRDEVYRRKVRLQDDYGITLKIDSKSGNWDNRTSFIQTVEANQSETGDNAYDIVGCYFAISGDMTVKGFFEDLSDASLFPYINFKKPWWPDDLLGSAKINNAVYAVTGDITPTFIRNMAMCHVNLDLLEKYNSGVNIYDIVRNKEWTYEKLEELSLGNSSATGAEREYALTLPNNVIYDNIFYSAGFLFIDNLEDGSIQLADLNSDQRYLDFYEYSYRLLNENPDVAIIPVNATADTIKGTGAGFRAGNAMFNFGSGDDVQASLTTVDFNLGIVPMPMYNTAEYNTQTDYYTVQTFWTTLYSIPTNSDDKAFASFTLEALASDAYRNLTPTWYDTMFKGRFLETVENAEMFDLIHDSIVFDTGRVFGAYIDVFSAFRKAASSMNWMSYYQTNSGKWNTAIDKINQSIG